MKNWILLLALVGLGWLGFQQWHSWRDQEATRREASLLPSTAIITQRDITFAISAAGEIGPADQVSVRPEINGRIKQLPVDIGDNVKKGDLLIALDDSDLQIERSQRQTEIAGALLQLERAERNFKRAQELFDSRLIAQEVFEDIRTDADLARNSLERLNTVLALVEDKLTRTRIMAPFDCTVLTRPVSIGQAVAGTSGMNAGTEMLSIANLNDMIINAHINQADVTRLREKMEVKVEVEAVNGLLLTGWIERIAPQATIKNSIKGFSTRIELKNAFGKVRPGMTANLTIPLSQADNVVAAPLAAVFTEKGARFAYVRTVESAWEKRPITIGVSDFQFAEVQSGLQVGEVVSLVLPEVITETPKAASNGVKTNAASRASNPTGVN